MRSHECAGCEDESYCAVGVKRMLGSVKITLKGCSTGDEQFRFYPEILNGLKGNGIFLRSGYMYDIQNNYMFEIKEFRTMDDLLDTLINNKELDLTYQVSNVLHVNKPVDYKIGGVKDE